LLVHIPVIAVKLRAAIERFRHRTGKRLTYEALALRTGLSTATLEALSSRPDYNTTISTIEKLCAALDCTPGDLLELIPDSPPSSRRNRPAGTRKQHRKTKHGPADR